MSDVGSILAKAKQLLVEKGWIKGDLHTSEGYCMLGAVNAATPDKHERQCAKSVLYAVIPDKFSSIDDYNDAESRSKGQVLAKFDKAISKCVSSHY